jgi:hypothetical protein
MAIHIRRHEFLVTLGGAVATWPHSQQAAERTYALLRVGCETTLLAKSLATAPESSSHEMFKVRARESHRGEVLRGVRNLSGPRLPELREPSFEHGKVLS